MKYFIILFLFFSVTTWGSDYLDHLAAGKALKAKIEREDMGLNTLDEKFEFNGKSFDIGSFENESALIIKKNFSKMSNADAKAYLDNYLKTNESLLKELPASSSEEEKTKRAYFLQNTKAMHEEVYGRRGLALFEDLCKINSSIAPLTDFWEKLQDFQKQKSNCADLAPGQSQLIPPTDDMGYLMQRKPDGNYRAVVALDMKYLSGSNTTTETMNKVRSCMAQASSRLIGPNNTKFEIVPLTVEELEKLPKADRPVPKTITLSNRYSIGHATNYTDVMECSTLTHELLHQFGLPDEYVEYPGRDLKFDCRVDSVKPRIMNDVWTAWEREMPREASCECDDKCKFIMTNAPQSIKNIWLAESPYEMGLGHFNQGCKPDSTGGKFVSYDGTSSLPAVEMRDVQEKKFTFIQRTVAVVMGSAKPFNFFETPWTCEYIPHEGIDPSLENEELMRFQKRREQFFKRGERVIRSPYCPNGMKSLSKNVGTELKDSAEVQGNVLKLTKAPESESLLTPLQFERILAGNCESKSEFYRKCSDLSLISINDKKCDKTLRASCQRGGYIDP